MTQRLSTAELVTCGQVWRRLSDDYIAVVKMPHRADRQVQMVGQDGARFYLHFTALRRKWSRFR